MKVHIFPIYAKAFVLNSVDCISARIVFKVNGLEELTAIHNDTEIIVQKSLLLCLDQLFRERFRIYIGNWTRCRNLPKESPVIAQFLQRMELGDGFYAAFPIQ